MPLTSKVLELFHLGGGGWRAEGLHPEALQFGVRTDDLGVVMTKALWGPRAKPEHSGWTAHNPSSDLAEQTHTEGT